MEKKEAIRGFIQQVYAFVIGFGFFTINREQIENGFDRFNMVSLILYLFTFFIAAHDWLEYHKKELPEKINFLKSIPQMFSLLAIGFMFNNSQYENILLWSYGAIALTIANLLGLIWTKNVHGGWDTGLSLFFIVLAIAFSYRINYMESDSIRQALIRTSGSGSSIDFDSRILWYSIVLFAIVIVVWIMKWHWYGRKKTPTTDNASMDKLLSEIQVLQNNKDQLTDEIKSLNSLKDNVLAECEEIKKIITNLKATALK